MAPTEFSQFLERRMERHRRIMHAEENALTEAIIDEVQALPARAPKSERLFDLLPQHNGVAASRAQ